MSEPVIRIDGGVSGQVVIGSNNNTTSSSGAANPSLPRPVAALNAAARKRVFVSHVREDLPLVDRLVGELREAGHEPWIDRDSLLPGMHWPEEIRNAIRTSDHFLACFSGNYWKPRSYMNEELRTAIGWQRQMSMRRNWFIPAKLVECELPDLAVESGESGEYREYLADTLHVADFAADWPSALHQLLAALRQ